ncbi:MAG TPA: hypothetical protein VL866_24575 [Pyrinomonadaceae bacterium]|nr:hypothetical protein [Pyrinomonadaceae bacterium]
MSIVKDALQTSARVSREESNGREIVSGQWYWVTTEDYRGKKVRWLGCVTHLGSNYIELSRAGVYNGSETERVHLNEFHKLCEAELHAEQIIQDCVLEYQQETKRLMGEVQRVTASLAIAPRRELNDGDDTEALVLRSKGVNVKDYKKALVKAKEKTLPDLFRQIRQNNEHMGAWMQAALLPLEAEVETLKPAIELIQGRIFNVELYAGLVEQVKEIKKGEPAPMSEPIHLFQRRAYMDEECLAEYETGGMEFKNLGAFDKWLVVPANLKRLLPHPRCILAFQVRRKEKKREIASIDDFIRMLFAREQDYDKLTFLYMRNGEQVFRLNTGIEFGAQLFPDSERSNLNGTVYAKHDWGKVERVIGESEYQGLIEDYKKARQHHAALVRDLRARKVPKDSWWLEPGFSRFSNGPDPKDYHGKYILWSPETVYYDDISEFIQDQIDKHNRLVLVLQGLLDRSPTFHPHPPWQLWSPEGFGQAIRLIYDDTRGLVSGDAPDFEAYRAKLNESLKVGSITVGQHDYWRMLEAEKYNRACRNNWRIQHHRDISRYSPPGNDGPGKLATVKQISKKGCSYSWTKDRERETWGHSGPITCRLTVPTEKVLNASAYQAGDFHIFFDDPRTRADYLQWAWLLLTAEEWRAGNRKVQK